MPTLAVSFEQLALRTSTTLALSAAVSVAFAQPHPADDAYDPGVIAQRYSNNFSNGVQLIVKCDLHDKESSLAGCQDAIGTRRIQLARYMMQFAQGFPVKDYTAKRLELEKQVADLAVALLYIRSHPANFSAAPPRLQFGHPYAPVPAAVPP